MLSDPAEVCGRLLGAWEAMTLSEIVEIHHKGQEYATILADQTRYPLLRDAKAKVLSFPPIINSRDIGEVRVGDSDLFVEVTGTDLRMVMLVLNIFAANLHDRGAAIEPVDLVYPWKTAFGRTLRMPRHFTESRKISRDEIAAALGTERSMKEIRSSL